MDIRILLDVTVGVLQDEIEFVVDLILHPNSSRCKVFLEVPTWRVEGCGFSLKKKGEKRNGLGIRRRMIFFVPLLG